MGEAGVTLLLGLAGIALALVLLLRGPRTLGDPRAQLRAVRRARIEARPILNRSELIRLAWLEAWARGRACRVFAQVPYGEMMRTRDEAAFRSVNAKRADFLITDKGGHPLAAVEYQGEGHWEGDARARDRVKRAALQGAGIALVGLFPDEDRKAALGKVEAALKGRL